MQPSRTRGQNPPEHGERLLRRDRRSVALTAAGEALLPHAQAMLARAAAAKETVAALSGLVIGRLAVGLVQPLPDDPVLRLLGGFRQRHPGVHLTLLEEETDALLAALTSGQLDAAVIGMGPYDSPPDDLQPHLFAREPALPPTHQLVGRASDSPADHAGRAVAGGEPGRPGVLAMARRRLVDA
ncbi:LysR substrate-binding domain-containing protein [Streptomyces sp. 8N616]|uniref:LysR substrate-binding domain-containing protein n=1 Tax=Streptomyces sp. 8N616 TaxID=3457414 RepID=UPI003FD4C5E3